MITASPSTRQPQSVRWQHELASALTSPDALIAALGLDPGLIEPARRAARAFRLQVPLGYVARMKHGDPNDPLLRQVLPLGVELDEVPGYVSDPLGEADALRAPGLLHKYQGRVLLVTTSACAIHCRYCFRREFPYADQKSDLPRWREALDVIANDASIEEVILSGGDPLSLSDSRLAALTDALVRIPHVKRLRIHTRQPVVLPSRVDAGLLEWLGRLPWQVVMVLHSNHANEIDASVQDACAKLRAAGVTLLNQSVLLRGVNDDEHTLAALSKRVFAVGVLPYYLFLLDKVRGAAHFHVPDEAAQRIAGRLAGLLPGYLVPKLAREVHGAPTKVTVPSLI